MLRRLHIFGFSARLIFNLLPVVAFALAWVVRFSGVFHFDATDYDPTAYFHLLFLTSVGWVLVADHFKLVRSEFDFSHHIGIGRTSVACCFTYMLVMCGLFFYRGQSFSRIFLLASALGLLLLGSVAQTILRGLRTSNRFQRARTRVLIIGADEFAVRAVSNLTAAQPSCQVVAFVRLQGQEVNASGAPMYELSDLPMLAHSAGLHDIVFAASSKYWPQVPEIIPMFERFSVPVRVILDFGSSVTIGDRVLRVGPMSLLNFGSAPFDTLEYVVIKRMIDVVVSVLGALLLSPLMLIIAFLVRATSPGPSLFVQDRVGLNGEVFRIFKFRTMTTVPSAHSDTVWSEPSQRCTPVGAFLRRWSLDELPQFFNVIKGEMSLVGPRPERPHFVLQFHEHLSRYNVRHQLKVGMTGWAQVNGLRGDTSIEERLRYDLFYLQNWSVAFDLRILLLTIASEWLGLKNSLLDNQSMQERRNIHLHRGHSRATRSASRM